MQKIKLSLLNRVIRAELSNLEFNFIMYLVQICDEQGESKGIYYKEVADHLHCSIAKFYQLRDSLTKKGFITWSKSCGMDIDIILIGNNFVVNGNTIYRDYLNTNIAMLNDKHFYSLKAKAKQLALEFVKRAMAAQKNKIWYIPYNEYKNMANILCVSVRMIKAYISDISSWIHLGHNIQNEGRYYDVVTILQSASKVPEHISTTRGKAKSNTMYPEALQHKHFVITYCRRNKIQTDELNINDTAGLIQQYSNKAKNVGKSIYNIVAKAICNTNSSKLNSINVHKALRNLIKYLQPNEIIDVC